VLVPKCSLRFEQYPIQSRRAPVPLASRGDAAAAGVLDDVIVRRLEEQS
jgi:hypothetical protein